MLHEGGRAERNSGKGGSTECYKGTAKARSAMNIQHEYNCNGSGFINIGSLKKLVEAGGSQDLLKLG